jgi:putative transposase
MAKPYSDDLRERVVLCVEGGRSRHQAAGQFAVSVSFVVKLMQRFQATGSFKPGDFGGHKEPKLARHEAVVRELVAQTPSATLLELQRKLSERGVQVGKSSIDRFLKRLRISFKKKRFARPSRSVRTSPPPAPHGGRRSRASTLGNSFSSMKPGRPPT